MNRLMSVGVLSLGKFMGVIGVFTGLIVGVIYGGILILFSLVGAAAGAQQNQGGAAGMAAFGVLGGVFIIILFPVFYGVVMFIGGLIYGLIVNLALRYSGGLELEIR